MVLVLRTRRCLLRRRFHVTVVHDSHWRLTYVSRSLLISLALRLMLAPRQSER